MDSDSQHEMKNVDAKLIASFGTMEDFSWEDISWSHRGRHWRSVGFGVLVETPLLMAFSLINHPFLGIFGYPHLWNPPTWLLVHGWVHATVTLRSISGVLTRGVVTIEDRTEPARTAIKGPSKKIGPPPSVRIK